MEILNLIKSRYSSVVFDPKPVETWKKDHLFEAARWSSSSSNLQPWFFIYALKEQHDDFNKLASLLDEGNYYAKEAPLLILTLAKTDSKHGSNRYAFHDVGLATAYMMLEAASLDLVIHPMGGYNVARAKEIYHLPANIEPAVVLAVGYLGDISKVSDTLRQKELNRRRRIRMDKSEFVFEGEWKGNMEGK